MSDLAHFMAGIRQVESGDTAGVYETRGKSEGGLVPHGAYGFTNWKQQAAAAGLADANMADPRAQDTVAARLFSALYQKFQNWDLVALAWFTNERVAEQVASGGYEHTKQFQNQRVREYVEAVASAQTGADNDDKTYTAPIEDPPSKIVPNEKPEVKRPRPSEMMASFVNQMSHANAGGERTNIDELAPREVLTPDELAPETETEVV